MLIDTSVMPDLQNVSSIKKNSETRFPEEIWHEMRSSINNVPPNNEHIIRKRFLKNGSLEKGLRKKL
jgi:hypothetical protein